MATPKFGLKVTKFILTKLLLYSVPNQLTSLKVLELKVHLAYTAYWVFVYEIH